MLPFVFEDGFGFERYVETVLDVPIMMLTDGCAWFWLPHGSGTLPQKSRMQCELVRATCPQHQLLAHDCTALIQ